MSVDQYCSVAKASEVLGEKWTLLIVRELLVGARRYSDLQQALPGISPSLLTKRLRFLEECDLLIRARVATGRHREYRLTEEGRDLQPVIAHAAAWANRWMRSRMSEEESQVEFLMCEIRRSVRTKHIPAERAAIRFLFTDQARMREWWLLVDGEAVDVCTLDPGHAVDLYINTDAATLRRVWQGELGLHDAIASQAVQLIGPEEFTHSMKYWLGLRRCKPAA